MTADMEVFLCPKHLILYAQIYFRESILNFCGVHSARMCRKLHLYDEYARKVEQIRTVEMVDFFIIHISSVAGPIWGKCF